MKLLVKFERGRICEHLVNSRKMLVLLDFARMLGECLRGAESIIWSHFKRVVEGAIDGELGLADLSSSFAAQCEQ